MPFKEVDTKSELEKDIKGITVDKATIDDALNELIEENPELEGMLDEIVQEVREAMDEVMQVIEIEI